MAPDENKNGLPDLADKIVGSIIAVVLAVLGVYGWYHPSTWSIVVVSVLSLLAGYFQVGLVAWPASWQKVATVLLGAAWTAMVALQASLSPAPEWLVMAQAGLGALAAVFGVGLKPLPGKSGPTIGPTVTVLLILGLTSCGGPYMTAYRTTLAVRDAGDLTDKTIAAWVDAEAEKCTKAGKVSPDDLRACVKATKAGIARVEWREKVRPAVNSALVLTVASIQIAEQAKKKDLDWVSILKPAACGLAKALEQWGAYFGPAREAIRAGIGVVKGTVCQ